MKGFRNTSRITEITQGQWILNLRLDLPVGEGNSYYINNDLIVINDKIYQILFAGAINGFQGIVITKTDSVQLGDEVHHLTNNLYDKTKWPVIPVE